jgi:pyruvyltransferase
LSNFALNAGLRLKGLLKRAVFTDTVPLFWSKSKNWGDALNPYLVKRIAGREARYEQARFTLKYQMIGSVLQRADCSTIVWGSGLISEDVMFAEPPRAILAVRGKKTLDRVAGHLSSDFEPAIGDPALLLPRYYIPDLEPKKSFRLGIVPHLTDRANPWVTRYKACSDVIVIDIEQSIEGFVNQVQSCEFLLSSSLHGLICADAYGIPRARIVLNDQIIGKDFKFDDHQSCLDRPAPPPLRPSLGQAPEEFVAACESYEVRCDLDRLLALCPFVR